MNPSSLDRRVVLLAGQYAQVFHAPAQAALGAQWTITTWETSDGLDDLIGKAAQAEVLIGSSEWAREEKGQRVQQALAHARRLGLVIIPFSGMDWLDPAWLPAGCQVCNVNSGTDPITEYVLGAMLQLEIPFQAMDQELRAHRWTWGGGTVMGRPHGELQGKTLGLIGFGRIGQRVAELAQAFRMPCVAVSRRPQEHAALQWWKDLDALPELLQASDYVLLTVPGGPETTGLLGAREMALMRPSSVLINVARGSVIDEHALFEALQSRRIRAAVIDTWYRYPTQAHPQGAPAHLPFESLDNLIMTPHAAGWTDALEARRAQAIGANLRRYLAGQPLDSVVYDTRAAATLHAH